VIQLDVDPLKSNMVMWDYPVTESHQVDTAQALSALLTQMEASPGPDAGRLEQRKSWLERYRLAPERPDRSDGGSLTPDVVSAVIGEVLGPNAVLIDETVSNLDSTRRFTARTRPGTYFGLPGGSLGWGGGAALGYRLVRPQADVAWLVGDGSFVFSVPSSLYMTAQHYGVPFLTVIYNNGGWNAVKLATDRMYGAEGQAARSGNYHHHIGATEHLEQVAAAFGCFAIAVDSLQGLHQALAEARAAMNAGNSAVINVLLASP
jgi:acetolactate synthase-1/2/3 large subunit